MFLAKNFRGNLFQINFFYAFLCLITCKIIISLSALFSRHEILFVLTVFLVTMERQRSFHHNKIRSGWNFLRYLFIEKEISSLLLMKTQTFNYFIQRSTKRSSGNDWQEKWRTTTTNWLFKLKFVFFVQLKLVITNERLNKI